MEIASMKESKLKKSKYRELTMKIAQIPKVKYSTQRVAEFTKCLYKKSCSEGKKINHYIVYYSFAKNATIPNNLQFPHRYLSRDFESKVFFLPIKLRPKFSISLSLFLRLSISFIFIHVRNLCTCEMDLCWFYQRFALRICLQTFH